MSRTFINIDIVESNVEAAILEAMAVSQTALSRLVRLQLSKPGTGRRYPRGKRGAGMPKSVFRGRGRSAAATKRIVGLVRGGKPARNLREAGVHVASAPGYPPAVDTNTLRASWAVSQIGGKSPEGGYSVLRPIEAGFVLEYGSSLFYAPMLEFGTNRMKARPYLRPVLPIADKSIQDIFLRAFRRRFTMTEEQE